MSAQELLLAGTWLLNAAALVWVIFRGIPTLARIRFLTRTDQLRDEAVDLILNGELPPHPAVLEFVSVQEAFAAVSKKVTLAQAISYDLVFSKMGVKAPPAASKVGLTKEQKLVLQRLEGESKHALFNYLVWGSAAVFVGRCLLLPARLVRRQRRRVVIERPNTTVLVDETYATARQGPKALLTPPTSAVPAAALA